MGWDRDDWLAAALLIGLFIVALIITVVALRGYVDPVGPTRTVKAPPPDIVETLIMGSVVN